MKALVTGGAGFIGSAVARALVARGDDVRVLDNFLTGSGDAIPDGVELAEADLRDLGAIPDAITEIDVVFHQGARSGVSRNQLTILVSRPSATCSVR